MEPKGKYLILTTCPADCRLVYGGVIDCFKGENMIFLSLLNKWRYYGIGRNEYEKCIMKALPFNLYNLGKVNIVIIILALIFALFPYFMDKNIFNAGIYIGTALVATFYLHLYIL